MTTEYPKAETLEQYLRMFGLGEDKDGSQADHFVAKVQQFGNGALKFYIHPDNHSEAHGDIPYFAVKGNEVALCGPNDEDPFVRTDDNTVTVQGASGREEVVQSSVGGDLAENNAPAEDKTDSDGVQRETQEISEGDVGTLDLEGKPLEDEI